MLRLLTLPHKVGQDMATLPYNLPYFLHRVSSKANNFVLFGNSEILFANLYFPLLSIYHLHDMIYCVLSEPCVYVSTHDRNVQAPQGADDIGTAASDSRGTLSMHSFSTART